MRPWLMVACAALVGAAFIGVLWIPGLSDLAILLISDGGQLAAAVLGAVGCAVAARRTAGPRRRAWWWLSAGTGSWAGGQAVWTYYEVILGQEVPFPSAADLGFLGFPLVAAVGLVMWLGTQNDQLVARGRDILDGALVGGSLLAVSWVTTLGSVVAEGGDPVPLALSLAYPLGDLILAALILLALARATGAERTTLVVLALGLGGLALSDSAYVYLVSIGAYSSADLISSGWVIGFLLVGVAGLTTQPADAGVVHGSTPARDLWVEGGPAPRPSLLRITLPYVPLVAAMTALCADLIIAPAASTVDVSAGRHTRGHCGHPAVPGVGRKPATPGGAGLGPRPARAPCPARLLDRAGEPGAVRGPSRSSADAAGRPGQRAVLRSRRLQGGQRPGRT